MKVVFNGENTIDYLELDESYLIIAEIEHEWYKLHRVWDNQYKWIKMNNSDDFWSIYPSLKEALYKASCYNVYAYRNFEEFLEDW